MRRKDIILDFTSLLDVVLIILFFFILFSHMEIENNKATVEVQMAEALALADKANSKMQEAEDLVEQLYEEIEFVRQADARRADNAEAVLEFARSQNVKMMLSMRDGSWELNISNKDEILARIPSRSDVGTEIVNALKDAGYTPEDTLFCEFILDGSKAGTASAYRTIDKAIKFVRSTYSNLYYSETDISIVED